VILNNTPVRQSNGVAWSQSQLNALETLSEIRAAWQVLTDVLTITGDTSPTAAEIKADLKALAVTTWAQLKTYPGP